MRAVSTTSKSKSTTSRRSPSTPLRASLSDYVYVYCAVHGAPNPKSVKTLPSLPDGAAPRVLPLTRTVNLIVADVPSGTYSGDAVELRLRDLDWVARCGTAHHAVADELAQKHAVVPFRLFTLFSSEEKARTALSRRAPRIAAALKRVAGKAEWVLRISGSPKPASDSTRADADAEDSGTSFLKRKAAARQAVAETAQRVREDSQKVFDTLAAIASESTHRDVDPGAGLALDAAFLVASRRLPAFKRALSKTAEWLLSAGCRVSLTGPWPPYSFVSLETELRRG